MGKEVGENQVLDFAALLAKIANIPISLIRMAAGNRKPALRRLIQDVSGVVFPGETLLVLGMPGAGCSTTLRTIASDTQSFVSVDGNVEYSGISASEVKKRFASEIIYNAEDDLHFPKLTVKQTLDFALHLRMPAKEVSSRRHAMVDEMRENLTDSLGIAHTLETIVGSAYVRGVSGGERKRVSLAEVLAVNAAVSCWDNPARGLDSSSALTFLRLLKDMSRITGMANIVTLYQAAETMYTECFDRVLVLYQGHMIFSGKPEHAKEYFVDLGYECAHGQTTPDFLTSITSPTQRSIRQDHVGPVPQTPEEFARAFRESHFYQDLQGEIARYKEQHNSNPSQAEDFRKAANEIRSSMVPENVAQPHSFFSQITTSIRRHYQLQWGDRWTLFTLLILNAANAVITGSCFYQAPKTAVGSYERGGAIFFSLLYFFLNALAETPSTIFSRVIVIKQRKLGIMHPSAYVIAQTIADIPLQLIQTLIFSCCYYFMLGLNQTASQFWIFELVVFAHYGAVCALYRCLGTIAPNINTALLFAGAAIPVGLTYSGFAPTTPTQHKWGSWIRRITPSPFALEALMGNEFNNIDLHCTDSQMIPNGPGYDDIRYQRCSIAGSVIGSPDVPGSVYLKIIYGFTRSHLWRNFGIVLVFWFLYTVISAIALSFTARERGNNESHVFKRGAKVLSKKFESLETGDLEKQPSHIGGRDISSESANTSTTQLDELAGDTVESITPGATFTFENVSYFVNVDGGEKQLLTEVSGYVKPGQLTALMGASGAGKTTLLDTISQRKSEGRTEGQMLLNGSALDVSFTRSCGFCMQQDVHEPLTTVREALQFSALLRQPPEVLKSEKLRYVEHILKLLELEPIADAIIGTPGESGLGVEERKRVTIGVELAAKPSALFFLDEPTSGLDSQAAFSIIRFLRKIAAEGLPVVCTIHQPSSVLFDMFDHVLLLAPGGKTIYFGETGDNSKIVMEYFSRHDTQMAVAQNPAEHIISSTAGVHGDRWHQYWVESPERAELENKLRNIHQQMAEFPKGESRSIARKYALPLYAQILLLTKRHWTTVWRDGWYSFSKTSKSIWCEMFVAFTFFNAGNDIQGLQNYVLSVLILIWIVQALAPDIQALWFSKWAIFDARERNGIYDWKALTTALVVVEVPWQIINFTLIYFVSYWTVGYPNDTTIAGYSYLLWMVISYFGTTWNQLISATFSNMQTAGLANSLFWNILMIFSGTLVPHHSLNTFYRYWLYWLDPIRWFFGGHVEDTLHNVPVVCSDTDLTYFDPPPGLSCESYAANFLETATGYLTNPNATSNCGYCVYTTGDDYAATMDYSYNHRWRDLGLCIVFCFTNTCLIFFVTWYKRGRKQGRGKRG
jgi:ATP-binding cassette subfamily G (WHITE) protein 2 (SNQ2)